MLSCMIYWLDCCEWLYLQYGSLYCSREGMDEIVFWVIGSSLKQSRHYNQDNYSNSEKIWRDTDKKHEYEGWSRENRVAAMWFGKRIIVVEKWVNILKKIYSFCGLVG
jgi:hypothetical protein